MSGWHLIALAGLVLALLELVLLVAVVVTAARLWRRVAPTVTPMLSMFGGTPAQGSYDPAGDTVHDSHGARVEVRTRRFEEDDGA